MVYDIIPAVPSAAGGTSVNASEYRVDCAALPQARDSGTEQLQNDPTDAHNLTSIFYIDDFSTAAIPPPCMWTNPFTLYYT